MNNSMAIQDIFLRVKSTVDRLVTFTFLIYAHKAASMNVFNDIIFYVIRKAI